MDCRYLVKREGVYYFRVMLPKELKRRFKIREIKKSLRTNDLLKARKLANLMHDCMKTLFKKAIEGMFNERQFLSLADEFLSRKLETNEDGFSLFTLPQANWTEQDVANQIVLLQDMQNKYKNGLTVFDDTLAYSFMVWLSQEKNISLKQNSPEAVAVARAFFKKVIPAADIAIARLNGNYSNSFDSVSLVKVENPDLSKHQEPSPVTIPAVQNGQGNNPDGWVTVSESNTQTITQHPPHAPTEQQSPSNTIGKLMDMYIKEQLSTGRWRATTIIDFKSHISLFLEYFGEHTPITNIKRQHLIEYRDNVVKRLPKNRVLNKAVKGLSMPEQLADETVEKISIKTANFYLGTIKTFMKWCETSEFIAKAPIINALINQNMEKKTRTLYSNDDIGLFLRKLATLPHRGENGLKNIDRTWIILLGMFQGLRENEICQLFIDNIVLHQGVPCLDITTSDTERQSVKNDSSHRIIPIHPKILKLGFLEFVNQRRSERDIIIRKRTSTKDDKIVARQLFRTMTHGTARNKHTKNFIYFFTKFNRDVINNPLKKFHSFRHSFISAINNWSRIRYVASYLCGQSVPVEADKTYTDPDMRALISELSLADYGHDTSAIFNKEPLNDEQIAEQAKALPEKE